MSEKLKPCPLCGGEALESGLKTMACCSVNGCILKTQWIIKPNWQAIPRPSDDAARIATGLREWFAKRFAHNSDEWRDCMAWATRLESIAAPDGECERCGKCGGNINLCSTCYGEPCGECAGLRKRIAIQAEPRAIPDCECGHLWAQHSPGGGFCGMSYCECTEYHKPTPPSTPQDKPDRGECDRCNALEDRVGTWLNAYADSEIRLAECKIDLKAAQSEQPAECEMCKKLAFQLESYERHYGYVCNARDKAIKERGKARKELNKLRAQSEQRAPAEVFLVCGGGAMISVHANVDDANQEAETLALEDEDGDEFSVVREVVCPPEASER